MSKTIYGCVTFPAGTIHFTEDSCTHENACIEWTGVHAGQVALTIMNALCIDTYYGCIDWTTGKFEVVIPDDCCPEWSEDDCTHCEEGKTPTDVIVRFSGLQDGCGGCQLLSDAGCGAVSYRPRDIPANVNGKNFAVPQWLPGHPCEWITVDVYQPTIGVFGYADLYASSNCTGEIVDTVVLDSIDIVVERIADGVAVNRWPWGAINIYNSGGCPRRVLGVPYFYGPEDTYYEPTENTCVEVSGIPNHWTECLDSYAMCYGGTAEVFESQGPPQ